MNGNPETFSRAIALAVFPSNSMAGDGTVINPDRAEKSDRPRLNGTVRVDLPTKKHCAARPDILRPSPSIGAGQAIAVSEGGDVEPNALTSLDGSSQHRLQFQ